MSLSNKGYDSHRDWWWERWVKEFGVAPEVDAKMQGNGQTRWKWRTNEKWRNNHMATDPHDKATKGFTFVPLSYHTDKCRAAQQQGYWKCTGGTKCEELTRLKNEEREEMGREYPDDFDYPIG